MKNGIQLIMQERARQIQEEGWSAAHDDSHDTGELLRAGQCYFDHYYRKPFKTPPLDWPWAKGWWKPKDGIRNLIKAGALFKAEIDRLTRLNCPSEIIKPIGKKVMLCALLIDDLQKSFKRE